jgi:hypothetical protein
MTDSLPRRDRKKFRDRSTMAVRHLVSATACLFGAMWSGQALAEAFSLECSYRESDLSYYVTIDRASGAAVFEGILNGPPYRGRIIRDAVGDLQFEIDFHPNIFTGIWQPATGLLTFVGVPGNDADPIPSSRCEVTAPRPAGRSLD